MVTVGLRHSADADADGNCECCGPGMRREVQTFALTVEARYAFIFAMRTVLLPSHTKLPREVLQHIFHLAAERRVVNVPAPPRFAMPVPRHRARHTARADASERGVMREMEMLECV